MSYTQMNLPNGKVTSQFDKQENVRVLVCGLNAAGKRSVLRVIKYGGVVATNQATGVKFETVIIDDIAMNAWENGGRCVMRPLWQDHYENAKALIFVVDSNDRNRIDEAREELHRITNQEELKYKPVLILANKQDLSNAMTLDELRDQLGLTNFNGNIKWHLQAACAIQSKGIKEGFEWLTKTFVKKTVVTKTFVTKTVVTKTDFTKSIVETIKDFTMMKNDLWSGLRSINLGKLLKQVVQI